jgi:DNA-binding CsgD family transcriptional regulator
MNMDESSVARADVGRGWSRNGISPFVASLCPFLAGLTEPVLLFDLGAHVVYTNPAFDERWHRPSRQPLPVPLSSRQDTSVRLSLLDHDGQDDKVPARIRLLHDFDDRPHAVVATVANGAPLGGGDLSGINHLIERLTQRLDALSPPPVAALDDKPGLDDLLSCLSEREREILHHVMSGKRIVTTAQALFLSEHTVRNYLKRIYRKLGVHSLGELRERLGTHHIPPPSSR